MKLIEVSDGVYGDDVMFVLEPASLEEEADFFKRVSALTSDTHEMWAGEDVWGIPINHLLISVDRKFEAEVRELLERYP